MNFLFDQNLGCFFPLENNNNKTKKNGLKNNKILTMERLGGSWSNYNKQRDPLIHLFPDQCGVCVCVCCNHRYTILSLLLNFPPNFRILSSAVYSDELAVSLIERDLFSAALVACCKW